MATMGEQETEATSTTRADGSIACPVCDLNRADPDGQLVWFALGVTVGAAFQKRELVEMICETHRADFAKSLLQAVRVAGVT